LRTVKPSRTIAAFELSSGVTSHSYSEPLQRRLTDFASDGSFGGAAKKAKEHYGIEIPVSGIRNVTLSHAGNMLQQSIDDIKKIKDCYGKRHRAELKPGALQIITETDGCMIPIVEINSNVKDKRKKKKLVYKEGRLCLSYKDGDVTPVFAATMGDVNTTGKYLRLTAEKSGLGNNSKIHAVGDGAQWIVNQLEEKFGDITHVNYLIDLYHMSEYLAAANTELTADEKKQKCLIKRQIKLLKNNEYQKVLHYFEGYKDSSDDNAVKDCYRYMINRPEQFAYKDAIENKLPIGSGKVEGGHRHVIQSRLKISGAWWLKENANSMLALRTARVNHEWGGYWKQNQDF
jgi:hypothetical protein